MIIGSPMQVFPMLLRVAGGSYVEYHGLLSVRYFDGEKQALAKAAHEGDKVGSLAGIDSNILNSS
jgi:hypothetical protein